MKNFYITFILFLLGLISLNVVAQKNIGDIPPSFSNQLTSEIDHIVLPAPNVNALLEEDIKSEASGQPLRFGTILQTNFSPANSGTWTDLPNGGRVWRLVIESKSALALGLYYSEFNLPTGSKLFVYNEDKSEVVGELNHLSNAKGEEFATDFTEGDVAIIEYYEPGKLVGTLNLEISGVSYVYKDVIFVGLKQKGGSQSCQVNVNCPEGNNWQDEKKGVARMAMVVGGGNYLCTGSLVNNTNQDCTPYFLTAQHCGEGASASELNQWEFYFGYEATTCSGTTAYYSEMKTGATKRAESSGSNPGSSSDLLLLELNQSTFSSYTPYLNGWNRSTTASSSGVCIHHPAGDMKKISTYSSTLTNFYGTHWEVNWVATATDHGVTEGGSSGSPLFDNNSRIVGTLTGGYSYCTAPNDADWYGKFSYHWSSNGSTSATQVQPWLDPAGTNPMTLDGIYYPCASSGVTANFSGSPTTVVEGNSVSFTDQSSGSISSWTWSFPGGTPSSSTSQNPTITYNTAGTYNVTLTVSNGSSSDTEVKSGYITVAPQGSGGCDTLRYPLTGTPSLYGAQGGGYLSGNNNYGDKAKVDYFDSYSPYSQIDGVLIAFGHAAGSGTCRVAVWNESGGTPGTMVGYKDINISTILTDIGNGVYTSVKFDSPITIPGNFYLGVILPTSSGDTVAIITNDDGESSPNTAWEQWSDNAWYAYDDANAWDMSMSHAISPIVCTGSSGFSNIVDADFEIFPNPANSQITISTPVNDYSVIVYNVTGEIVMNFTSDNRSENIIDISNLTNGIYHFVIQTKEKQITKKLSVIR